MRLSFWLRRFAITGLLAFLLITAGQLVRGRSLDASLLHGLMWSQLCATIFVATQYRNSKRNISCPLCQEVPDRERS